MKLQITTLPNGVTIRLQGTLDIYSVEAARQALLDHLAGKTSMRLDLGMVEECDAAGLQLLLATRRSAATVGKAFRVEPGSAAVECCANALGIAPEDWRASET